MVLFGVLRTIKQDHAVLRGLLALRIRAGRLGAGLLEFPQRVLEFSRIKRIVQLRAVAVGEVFKAQLARVELLAQIRGGSQFLRPAR